MPTLITRPSRAAASTAARRRRTRKIALAIVGSLLVHGLLIVGLGWVLPHWPKSHLKGKPLGPITVTILPSTEPTPTPSPGTAAQNSPEYMRTLDDQKADETPKDPAFISDKDTLAASEKPATGNVPMPTQDGREAPSFDFDTRNYTAGREASDASAAASAAQAQRQTTVEQKTETPQPTATPPPTKSKPRRANAALATPPPNAEMAAPKAEPSASPEPPAPTPEKPDTEEGNTPPVPTQQQSRTKPTTQSNPAAVPNPGQIKTPGYQPQTIQSKFSGNINNRGRSAVQALGTPMGRYIKTVQDSIGALWYYRVEQKMDVLGPGRVHFHFYVDRTGKPVRVRVVEGARDSALSSVSNAAILDADIPPIPPDLVSMLPEGEIEMDLSFDMM